MISAVGKGQPLPLLAHHQDQGCQATEEKEEEEENAKAIGPVYHAVAKHAEKTAVESLIPQASCFTWVSQSWLWPIMGSSSLFCRAGYSLGSAG